MRRSSIVVLLAALSLAAPAGASAHARSATVALDYKLVLDAGSRAIRGMSVAILDGDRDLRISARGRSMVTVFGDLGEPMLRIGPAGAWVNRGSVTAAAEKLTAAGRGWKRLSPGATFTWHEHRLAPPPWRQGAGKHARFVIPVAVNGRRDVVAGTFVRHARPALWPWTLLAIVLAGLAFVSTRFGWAVATPLGAVAGAAAVTALAAFSVADAPNGRVAWTQLGLGLFLAAVMFVTLIRSHGSRRAAVSGLLGAIAAAVSLGSIGVFRHGVVISALPAQVSRLLVEIALVWGAAAAVTSIRREGRR
jgi:hypothetical protein